MRRLAYHLSGDNNIEEMLEYIARDNVDFALSFIDELRQQCRMLAALPTTLDTPRPKLDRDLRSFTYKGYVISFRYVGDVLEVVSVLEGHATSAVYSRD